MSFIKTFTGKKYYYDNPTPDMIDIADIAHALSNQCRFAGQCTSFYSVAQHSTLCAKWVFETTYDKEAAKYALLHDASEAYCVDVPRPLKYKLGNYRMYEDLCQTAIHQKFDMRIPDKYSSIVSEVDNRILFTEADNLITGGSVDFSNPVLPLDIVINPWTQEKSKFRFLLMYSFLFQESEEYDV